MMKPLLILAFLAGTAWADEPWEQGVPQARRDQAQALFAEGNALFAQQAHQPALEKYKAAIALWDHPLIRFNMAVTLVRLDRILEAADDLDSALRFGAQPFTPELYRQAQDYQKLVSGRVGNIEASCDAAGAQVLLDGKPWFACPATRKQRVLTGEHVVVGEKQGFLTISRRMIDAAVATASTKLALLPLDAVVKLEYPSPRWLPWTTASAGAAILLGGLGLRLVARNQMDQFEADFHTRCPNGCAADYSDVPDLERDRDSAELKGQIAVTMMVAGGVATVGGAVWVFLNRPRRVLPTMEVAPTNGGMTARVGWQF
jgi:tetratricopeptide (TPR) repeat protein